jgi:hypothetical protein
MFFVSMSTGAFLAYEISRQGLLLEEQVTILAENNSKEETYLNIKRTVQETEKERAEIASKFFKDENDSIYFLNTIETIAPNLGLSFKTESLDDVTDKDKKSQSIKMTFVYSGKESSVLAFTKMMENIPYHSYIDTLSLKELEAGLWEGKITILVSVKPS